MTILNCALNFSFTYTDGHSYIRDVQGTINSAKPDATYLFDGGVVGAENDDPYLAAFPAQQFGCCYHGGGYRCSTNHGGYDVINHAKV